MIADTENDLQSLIDKAFKWSKNWCITFNPKKCNITHHRPKSVTVSDYKFCMRQTHIKTVNSCKYLGIIIDDHLNFDTCINTLTQSGTRALGALIHKHRWFSVCMITNINMLKL